MHATEFLLAETFLSRTLVKHIESQQKSTQAKYEKSESFLPLSFCPLDDKFYAN